MRLKTNKNKGGKISEFKSHSLIKQILFSHNRKREDAKYQHQEREKITIETLDING